jgi:hypothetical protein
VTDAPDETPRGDPDTPLETTDSTEIPALSPLRGPELLLGLGLFGGAAAASALLVGPAHYQHFSAAFGQSPREASLALALVSLAAGLASLLPWLVRAPAWLLSLSLFLAMSAATPVLLVRVIQPEDPLACSLFGLVLGGLLGALYAAQIDWSFLEGGPLLGAPCALAGLLLLPGALHMLSPSLSELLGLGEVALGGALGYGVGSLAGGFLDDYARGLSAALCFVPGGATLGIGILALHFAIPA